MFGGQESWRVPGRTAAWPEKEAGARVRPAQARAENVPPSHLHLAFWAPASGQRNGRHEPAKGEDGSCCSDSSGGSCR